MGLTNVLDIAKSALLASQTAIQTTSHNISNVNTPGYTRQRVTLAAAEPVMGGGFYIGSGVDAAGVERIYDRFLGLQVIDGIEAMGRYNGKKETLARLEGILNDAKGLGLGGVLNDFFNALSDVINDPSSYAARTALISKAQTLSDRINNLDSRIQQEINNIEAQIKGEVDEINSLIIRIADLNDKIQQMEAGGGQQANDLRDQRQLLIQELAEKIDITVLDDNSSHVAILTASGSALLNTNNVTALSVAADADNNGYYDIMLGSRNITDSISSGRLKGLMEARDAGYQNALTRLETLSASITKEFNVLHRQGYGLDSSTGNNFFTALSPIITPKSANTGGAAAMVAIQTLSSLTLDNYEIRFTGISTFSIINTTEGTIVSSGNSYTSGANIDFDGIRAVITNGTGTPQPGDVFKVSVTDGAAEDFGVSLTDPNKFAAAKSTATLPGDNTNAIDMFALKESKALSNGSATFNDFYAGLVSDIGVAASEAGIQSEAQQSVLDELEAYRDSVSGVSLDEEAANLLKYQYAYQAAAKIITVVDNMLETLVNLR